MSEIAVDDSVKNFIIQNGQDYRICTSCSGPVMLPVSLKSPKSSDIVIKVGSNTLYISRVQARYIRKVTTDMIYDPNVGMSCSYYPGL
ncbi:MAG: hypothetical protein A4E29_00904 [Methanomassiliicoccales archaeon PtaB.Bin134]|jgi:S-adenosylmethionine:diacylglycerol 3-amino-3-carboxypropyl transferase|nr:MAG: hypothetical protein A4E29_00904 [Methanomassiliicoccales archaeon PtaB.Bin134]